MIRTWFLLVGSLLLVGAFAGANQDDPVKDKEVAKEPPQIRLVGISHVPNDKSRVRLHFEASNPNGAPLPYVGYQAWGFTPHLPKGVIAPMYNIEFRREGKWQREPIGWCGTGEGPVELPSNGKATFDVNVLKEGWEAAKVGVDWFSSPDRKGVPSIAWSQDITAKDITKSAVKPPQAKEQPKQPAQDRVQELKKLVKIVFPKDGYTFTLAEAAKGIKFEYKIVVQEDIKDVIPLPFPSSYREPPGPSGLFPQEQIVGMGQHYCLCDFGNVPVPPKEVVTKVKKGAYSHTFEWDGRNWNGPSDTNTPKGKSFPAGTYDVTVSFYGKLVTDKDAVFYRIEGKSKLVLK